MSGRAVACLLLRRSSRAQPQRMLLRSCWGKADRCVCCQGVVSVPQQFLSAAGVPARIRQVRVQRPPSRAVWPVGIGRALGHERRESGGVVAIRMCPSAVRCGAGAALNAVVVPLVSGGGEQLRLPDRCRFREPAREAVLEAPRVGDAAGAALPGQGSLEGAVPQSVRSAAVGPWAAVLPILRPQAARAAVTKRCLLLLWSGNPIVLQRIFSSSYADGAGVFF